jgi:hypothetical protein
VKLLTNKVDTLDQRVGRVEGVIFGEEGLIVRVARIEAKLRIILGRDWKVIALLGSISSGLVALMGYLIWLLVK